MAREKGLEPLANIIMEARTTDLLTETAKFINPELEVNTSEEALAGARDIIAEIINEDAGVREKLRNLFDRQAVLKAKVVKTKEEEAGKYKNYFEFEKKAAKVNSHQFLAIQRGVNEGLLRMSIEPADGNALQIIDRSYLKGDNKCTDQLELAIDDTYKRLLKPSLENEIRSTLKSKADNEAIVVFAENLKGLLMAPPLGQKNTLAIDPGYRTGCKVVCINKQGELLHNTTIFPHSRNNMQRFEAIGEIEELVEKYQIEAIAVGNGTAGRETLSFIEKMAFPDVQVVSVNESGASIYSASEVAREEFPDYDVTVRGSVSIGRRLMDPLAELVKIDPKSIGVGQYQHDVDQGALKKSLDDVVISCVNRVGVEINTASKQLLTYISGLGEKTAQNIVNYRSEKGAFKSKKDLKKVKGIGEKSYEQAAGFIRIHNAKNPLDSSAVHPESYHIVEAMAKDRHCSIAELIEDKEKQSQIPLDEYKTETIGLPTLQDILQELAKPGRDPRNSFEQVSFDDKIRDIEDLKEGIVLNGIITNVTNFGAFVDIGIKENGLVHISEITDKFIKDPNKFVKVNQAVQVKVIGIDIDRKRINLSIKQV